MNREIAKNIANTALKKILSMEKDTIFSLMDESYYEMVVINDVEYQVRGTVFYDDEKTKNRLHISVAVDDIGFWSTLFPLIVSDLIDV